MRLNIAGMIMRQAKNAMRRGLSYLRNSKLAIRCNSATRIRTKSPQMRVTIRDNEVITEDLSPVSYSTGSERTQQANTGNVLSTATNSLGHPVADVKDNTLVTVDGQRYAKDMGVRPTQLTEGTHVLLKYLSKV